MQDGASSTDAAAPHLSIVIPAYDEEQRIGPTLEAILAYTRRVTYPVEILVVDDGSRDRTFALAGEILAGVPVARVVTNGTNRGKGYSIRHGVLEARGTLVLVSDADLSTPIEEVDALLRHLGSLGHGLVIGSRALHDSRVEIHQNAVREMMGKTFNRMVRMLTGLPFHDTQCGFKLMTRADVLPIFRTARVDGFSWDVEILYVAIRRGVPIKEVPVRWRNAPGSKVGILADPWRMLRDVMRIRRWYRQGVYDVPAA